MAIEAESKPTETGNRGSICVNRRNDVVLVLPGNIDSSLSVVMARKSEGYRKWATVWRGQGFDGEPCVDVGGLEVSDVLSVFTRMEDVEGKRSVVVLNFGLEKEDGVAC